MLQLENQKRTDSLVYRLLKDAFDDLIAHRWSDLASASGWRRTKCSGSR